MSTVSVLGLGITLLYACARLFLKHGYSEVEALGVFAALMVVMTGAFVVLMKRLRREEKSLTIDYLNLGVQRYVLALFMVNYGVPKLFGRFFDYQLFALDSPMGMASDFELAWYYFGLNPWQELIAGLMELLPGLLLLHRRTYYLAAVVLLPVVGQVFVLNFFFKIGGLTFPFAAVLLACNLSILASEMDKILAFVRSLNTRIEVTLSASLGRGVLAGRLLVVGLCLFFIAKPIIAELTPNEEEQRYNALVGVYSLESMKKSGVIFDPATSHDYYKDLYFERQERFNTLRRFDNKIDAFMWRFSDDEGGFTLKINAGGIGDRTDVLDEESALTGRYSLNGDRLILTGTQNGESLELSYLRREPHPKSWFW